MTTMLDLAKLKQELQDINKKIEDALTTESSQLSFLFSRQAELQEIVDLDNEIYKLKQKLEDATVLLESEDQDIAELAKEEVHKLQILIDQKQQQLLMKLIPADPNDKKKCNYGNKGRHRWRRSCSFCERSI